MGAFYPMLPRWNVPGWFKRSEQVRIQPTLQTVEPAAQASMQDEDARTRLVEGANSPRQLAQREIATELARIWEKLLDIESVQLDENYFDLGGDSSLTIRLFAQIEKKFNVRLPIVTLFEAPTVGELANAIWRAKFDALPTYNPE